MTIVLVHGVPESAAIWDEVLAQMQRDDVVRQRPLPSAPRCPTVSAPRSVTYRRLRVSPFGTFR